MREHWSSRARFTRVLKSAAVHSRKTSSRSLLRAESTPLWLESEWRKNVNVVLVPIAIRIQAYFSLALGAWFSRSFTRMCWRAAFNELDESGSLQRRKSNIIPCSRFALLLLLELLDSSRVPHAIHAFLMQKRKGFVHTIFM